MHPSMLYKLDMCGVQLGLIIKLYWIKSNANIYYDIVCTIARAIEVVSSFLRRMESEF
jgi:hypothetical protein